MRVLLAHNFYNSEYPSGENAVVLREQEALERAGVDVVTYFRSSDELVNKSSTASAKAVLGALSGRTAAEDFRRLLRSSRPDVVHLHNPYPLISPAVIEWCRNAGVPVVATIHNFRLRCPSGLFFRDGSVCTDCEARRLALPAVVHGCYRDSRLQSAVMTTALWKHRERWEGVSRFVAVSEFVAQRLSDWGVPADRIVVKPNAVDDPGPSTEIGAGFLFAGRLSSEKGVLLLLDAWERSGLDGTSSLIIAGDGPLRDEVERRARRLRHVDVVGNQNQESLRRLRRQTAAGVLPSLCFEAHPSVGESFAAGRPVVAVGVGAVHQLAPVEVGWLAAPRASDLAARLIEASDPVELKRRGDMARIRYLETYHPDLVTQAVLEIYRSVGG